MPNQTILLDDDKADELRHLVALAAANYIMNGYGMPAKALLAAFRIVIEGDILVECEATLRDFALLEEAEQFMRSIGNDYDADRIDTIMFQIRSAMEKVAA